MESVYHNEARPSFYAATAISAGQICVLDATKKLTPLTADLLAKNLNTALLFALTDAVAGEIVAVKIAGASGGTVIANCEAGTLVPGMPVYASDAGAVSATKPDTNARIVGVYVDEAATTTDTKAVEIALVFAVGA